MSRRSSTGTGRSGRRRCRVRRPAAGLAAAALLVGSPALAAVAGLTPPASAAVAAQPAGAVTPVSARTAVPSGAASLGRVAASKVVAGDVALLPRDPAALQAYAAAVSTPGSADYHDYLTVAGFAARFGPTAATISAVEGQLRAGGLRVVSISADGLLVDFHGSASEAEATFHTGIDNYRLRSGREVFANTAAPALPVEVAGAVEAVVGLNDLSTPEATPIEPAPPAAGVSSPRAPAVAPPAGGLSTARASVAAPPAGAATACNAASSTAEGDNGLTDSQIASAYGLDPLYRAGDFGAGEQVDILDLFGYARSDVSAFDNCYFGRTAGAKVLANLSATSVDGGSQLDNGFGAETELDVEEVAAMAPQAKVDVFEGPSTNAGFLDAVAAMTDDPAAHLESISYGECEQVAQTEQPGYTQIENSLFEQAAAEGKTVLASSGDSGGDSCSSDGQPTAPALSVSDPASQPYVTGVGGTAITDATDPPAEEVWNDGGGGGSGGGGISSVWPEPSWQAHAAVPGLNNESVVKAAEEVDHDGFCLDDAGYAGRSCREVPDVSAAASPNTGGITVYLEGAWTVIGGTSASSPLWAAILADIDSTASCSATGGVGFVSPALYAIASVPAEYAASFNDITIGNNDNFGAAGGLYPATKGYDMASGLGSPRVTGANGARGLAYYLCAAPAAAAPLVAGVSPPALSSTALGAGATLTVTGSGFFAGGTSDVAGVTIGTFEVPAADVHVTSGTELDVSAVPAVGLQEGDGGTPDGTGTYDVTVTVTGGATSAPGPASTVVLYDAGTTSGTAQPVVDGTFPSAGVETGERTVTIYGSGFTSGSGTPSVTFGGVAATGVKVIDENAITADAPAYDSGATSCLGSDDPATGACQVQVQVTTASGASTEGTIPPEYGGVLADDPSAAGTYPVPTEYDYEPAPTLTSVSFEGGQDVASEAGGTAVVIKGTGLGPLGMEWVNVGSYQEYASEVLPTSEKGWTKLVLALPAQGATAFPETLPVTVQTYGSANSSPPAGAPGRTTLPDQPPSNALFVTYAPVPVISVSTGSTYNAGPTSGGTSLTIVGSGFADADEVLFIDREYGFPTTQHRFAEPSLGEITLRTPAALTGKYNLEVCGVSGCSTPPTGAFMFYLPGDPAVTSITPRVGAAGTKVTITGDNLGYLRAVYFGGTMAKTYANTSTFFESGDVYQVTATVPAGAAGRKVDVRVKTLESLATGYGKSRIDSKVTFTYRKARKA